MLVTSMFEFLVITYKLKIHLVNTWCWTQHTSVQHTINESNQTTKHQLLGSESRTGICAKEKVSTRSSPIGD